MVKKNLLISAKLQDAAYLNDKPAEVKVKYVKNEESSWLNPSKSKKYFHFVQWNKISGDLLKEMDSLFNFLSKILVIFYSFLNVFESFNSWVHISNCFFYLFNLLQDNFDCFFLVLFLFSFIQTYCLSF